MRVRQLFSYAPVLGLLISTSVISQTVYQKCDLERSAESTTGSIEINFTRPPSKYERGSNGFLINECRSTVLNEQEGVRWIDVSVGSDELWRQGRVGLSDCVFGLGACAVENPDEPVCLDGPGAWLDVEIVREMKFRPQTDPAPVLQEPWKTNPSIEVHLGFKAFQRYETIRWWPWDTPTRELSLGVQERVVSVEKTPRCYTMAHLFGFFNGVWNTRTEAEESLRQMERQSFLGPSWREAPVRYELFYNQTCKRSEDDVCLQDVAEVFRQRSAELDGLLARRWEYFWEQVTGQHDQPGSFTQRLLARLERSEKALNSWFDGLYNAVLAKITAVTTLLAENPPTAEDTAAHTAQLIAAGQRAERAVLVAHSQGNLFVNAAYDAYLAHSREVGRAQGEDTNYVAAKVVHIAPASPTLRGPWVLADIDVVINGLRRVDGTYLPVSNFSMAVDAKDRSGHKLLDTYLDEARPARAHILELIQQALDAL